MEVRNCKECGKIFNYMEGAPFCPSCVKKMNEKYEQVKEYVYENPGVSINQVAEENEVSVQQIKRWIREEKLEFSEQSDIGIECEKCGAMIKTGRFCNKCKKIMEDTFGNVYQKPKAPVKKERKPDANARMRFLDR